jgi:cation transport regulator ChaB
MVPGFNHNVRRRGKAYHVQTEDLGLANPVLVTHLFSGGDVVATCRSSYADLAGAEDRDRRVRERMEEQHKQVLRNLVNGAYDEHEEASPRRSAARFGVGAHAPPLVAGAAVPAARPVLERAPDDGLEKAILSYLAGERDE